MMLEYAIMKLWLEEWLEGVSEGDDELFDDEIND